MTEAVLLTFFDEPAPHVNGVQSPVTELFHDECHHQPTIFTYFLHIPLLVLVDPRVIVGIPYGCVFCLLLLTTVIYNTYGCLPMVVVSC